MPVETVRTYLMDASSGPSVASMGVSGLLREGWSGLSEVLTPSGGLALPSLSAAATPSPSLYHAQPAQNQQQSLPSSGQQQQAYAVSHQPGFGGGSGGMNSGDLLELTSRLTRQLKRAEETCRRIETREKQRVELLKRCLIACCAKESAEVLERALEIAMNEEPDVDKESREFKELLVVRSEPGEKIEVELNRVAQLEHQLKEERALRNKADEEKAVVLARLKTQQEAWEKERERFYEERKSVEETVKERVAVEANSFAVRLKAMEQTHRDKIQLETAKLQDRIRTLETRLEKETQVNRQRKELDEQLSSDMVKLATSEKDQELEKLRRRVEELEDSSKPEREFMALAKAQATKERVLLSLQNRVKELELTVSEKEFEISELKTQAQGAVPSENLGPARGDYLRHVLLRYMTFENVSQKATLIPVLSLLLNFSPDEKKQCEASAARDLAREGIIGQLSSTFQAMPVQSLLSSFSGATSPAIDASSALSPAAPRAIGASSRYIPVSTNHSPHHGVAGANGE